MSTQLKTSQPRIIVVGAGMAGISAAHHLVQSGFGKITVLEASNRIGGRIYTRPFGAGIVELGANWIHGATLNNSVFCLAAQNGILGPKLLNKGFEGYAYHEDGRVIENPLQEKAWSVFSEIETEADEFFKENRPTTQTSYEEFFRMRLKEKLFLFDQSKETDVKALFNCFMNYLRFHNGGDVSDISLKLIGKYETLPGGNIRIPGRGYVQLFEALIKDLPENTIRLNMEVSQITWKNGILPSKSPNVHVRCINGDSLDADHVIVTCSLGYLKQRHKTLFVPSLPVEKVQAIERLAFGTVNKIFLQFEKPFWKLKQGGVNFAWSCEQAEPRNQAEWYKRIFAFDEVLDNPNVLCGWISGKEAEYVETLDAAQVAEVCMTMLRKFLDNPSLPDPSKVIVSKWRTDPYANGSYSFLSLQSSEHHTDNLQKSLFVGATPVVFFAGEATHPRWFSTAHGARSSGLKEAKRIIRLYRLKGKL